MSLNEEDATDVRQMAVTHVEEKPEEKGAELPGKKAPQCGLC
jgi:hypothetical protein